ncbi:flavoprotein [Planococcus alpniumensis]|uniref:flavoprotein n=1 Tax=Planococcus alpniumensis TaxID=2708345 RepID=UPI0020113D1A|nr:flavoprotein [Planococcus sp. MSAK28401]
MELLGVFLLTILCFILCIAGFLHIRKTQKNKPLPHIKYYGIQIILILFALLSFVVFWDASTVMPKMIKGDHDTVMGACSVEYWTTPKDSFLDIHFSENVFFSVAPNYWDNGSLAKAYCEVIYYEGSDFGIHYKIYDQKNGTLLQQH